MIKIGIIINPNSKRIRKVKALVDFYKKIGRNSAIVRVTQNLDEITKAAIDFKKEGITCLAISGGDGSIHNVLSRFIPLYKQDIPKVLILKDGSMNLISKSFGLKGKGRDILKRLIAAIDSSEEPAVIYRNTIKVNNMYCFIFGAGLTANFINEFNKNQIKSRTAAAKLLVRLMIGAASKKGSGIFGMQPFRVIADGKELNLREYFAVFAATVHNLAISFNPTPRAYEREDTFHLIATGLRPWEVLIRLNKIRRGQPIKHARHFDNIASKVKITYPGEFLYQMDGDVYKANNELLIEAGPRIGFLDI